MVKRKLKVLFALLGCLILIIALFCGCRNNTIYQGAYPDLYTVAINSILWNAGYSQYHHGTGQAKIKILEKDDYGRTLYIYSENAKAQYNLVISQYYEEDYVYYYEDFNFLQKEITGAVAFSEEETDYLKSLNDWGKKIDFERCVKKQITNIKASIPCDKEIIKEKVVQNFDLAGKNYWVAIEYLTSDNLGNFILYGYTGANGEDIYFAIIIRSDCEEFKFFVPSELFAYQEEFKNFKAENGWVSK